MKLEPLMSMRVDLKAPVEVGAGPFGVRVIFDSIGGTFEGPRLRGTVEGSGGDWLLVDTQGVGRLDVRATLVTEDGAKIYLQYPGVLVMNEKVQTALIGGGTFDWGDTYFVTQPRFETGDERYQWLNRTMAVAEGRGGEGWVEYRFYECLND